MSRLVINMRESRTIWTIPDWAIEEIRTAAPPRLEVVVVEAAADGRGDGGGPSPEAIAAVAGAEIYFGFGFPKPLFDAAARSGGTLRWVHTGAAGVGGALYSEMLASSIRVTNSAGVHAEPIADSVLGMVLHFARGFDFAVDAQRRAAWEASPFEAVPTPVRELAASTMGIVGYGGIGHAVGRRALCLGMRVLAFRRDRAPEPEGVEQLTGADGLSLLLRESHYVVVCLPRTPETKGLLGPDRIASLRTDAVVINVGRGGLIDEPALAEALRAGRLRGAGLDVFDEEPLPPDSPFWGFRNVLVTPHVSATSSRFWRRQTNLILENLHRYEAGEPLLNLVDKGAGY